MRRFAVALVGALALAVTATAGAVDFGANDDTGKYADNPAPFFQKMAAMGLKQNVMTVRWTPGSSAIADQGFLDRAVPVALANGVKVIFAVYPYPPSAIEVGQAAPDAFASWLGTLASRYPQVTTYIVGNEPNLNTFWRPQGDGSGKILSAPAFGPFLASAYDALKPRGVQVLGVGHSPRGDLTPHASAKTAPVAWIKALGEWYRSSGRTAPLMDGFSYHPYPNPSDFSVPITFTYGWPNAGVQELARVKQALWDAFNGTSQPTTVSGLKLFLDEVGWQVDTTGKPGYTGNENVRVATEEAQAQIYAQLVHLVVCDPDVAQLNLFGFYDEVAREGWQAAPHLVDGTPRASAASMAQAIAQTGGNCAGALRSWSPERGVVGAAADFGTRTAFDAKQKVFSVTTTAEEDYAWSAGVFPSGTSAGQAERELAARLPARLLWSRAAPIVGGKGQAKAYSKARVEVRGSLAEGTYVLAVKLASWANPARSKTFVSAPFTVGGGSTTAQTQTAGVQLGEQRTRDAAALFEKGEWGELGSLGSFLEIQFGEPKEPVWVLTTVWTVVGPPSFALNAVWDQLLLDRILAGSDGTTAKPKRLVRISRTAKPGKRLLLRVPIKKLKPGTYVAAFTFTSVKDRKKRALAARVFTITQSAKPAKAKKTGAKKNKKTKTAKRAR